MPAGTLAGTGPLDTPPPSPDVPGGGVGGPQSAQMPTLSGLAPPASMGAAQMPPEILTGILAAAQKITELFQSFAQVTPDLAMDWDLCTEILKRTLGKLVVAGGGPITPNAVGSQFPGGGINQGVPASPGAPS